MRWILLGYIGFYTSLAVLYSIASAAPGEPISRAILGGLLVSGIALLFFADFLIGPLDEGNSRVTIKSRLKSGELTRKRLFLSGLLLAVVSALAAYAILNWFPETWFIAKFVLSGLVVFGSPLILVGYFGAGERTTNPGHGRK